MLEAKRLTDRSIWLYTHTPLLDKFLYNRLPWLEDRLPLPLSSILLVTLSAIATSFVFLRLATFRAQAGVPVHLPCPPQAQPGWSGTILPTPSIGTSGTITCYDPATGYHIASLPADTPLTIQKKLGLAKKAQLKWRNSPFSLRRKVLRTIQKWVVEDMETIARVASRDTGKTAIDAAFGELLTTCSKLDWTVNYGEKVLRQETRPNTLLLAHKVCSVHHEPLGVVLACVSWNYSAHNTMGPIIAAIFAGNAIVVKASELVAWSATYFIQAIRECLRVCGADPELVQLVTCFPSAAESLTTSPDVSHITFIGSEEVGRKVAQAATKQLTPVTLELGGKDPAILLKSADLKYFNSTLMRSCFQGAGQNCIGIERFVVHDSLVEKLVGIVRPRIEALRCGSFMDDSPFGSGSGDSVQVDCGAMITDLRFSHLERLISDAVERGATLHLGGKRFDHPRWTKGHYFTPTLLSGVKTDMAIANEELFAPIFLIMPFSDNQEALRIANSTRYGLGSSVFGSDRAECEEIAQRLQAGMVNINDFGVSYLNQHLPFGGVKKSGYGRFGGPEGLLSLTSAKAITRDRLFSLIRTGIPPHLDYPLSNPSKSWNFVKGLVAFAYADSLSAKVKGVLGLIRP